ncbi:hypothetical protein [Streptomyces microflavus]|uniref:hypothetical protein n=1 Tax=Streptomyces microflavus TaxID=1919 RepID=UPI00365DFAF7
MPRGESGVMGSFVRALGLSFRRAQGAQHAGRDRDPGHKITAAGAALSARFNLLRAPRSLPSPIVMTR